MAPLALMAGRRNRIAYKLSRWILCGVLCGMAPLFAREDEPAPDREPSRARRILKQLPVGEEAIRPWLTLSPGVSIQENRITVRRGRQRAELSSRDPLVTAHLDVMFPELPLSDRFGLQLIWLNSAFRTDVQIVRSDFFSLGGKRLARADEDGGESSSENSNSNSSSGSSSGGRTLGEGKRNIGTETRGYYSIFMPALSYSESGARLGIGFGSGWLTMQGTVDFDNPSQRLLNFQASTGERADLSAIPAYFYGTGLIELNDDPWIRYLVWNLTESRNLETLGYYFLTQQKRGIEFQEVLLTKALASVLTSKRQKINDVELYGLIALARPSIDFRNHPVNSYMMYLEIPTEPVGMRFDIGGPLFQHGGFDYRFLMFNLTLFVPIDFGRFLLD